MQFTKGRWLTKSGNTAVVAQIKSVGMQFVMSGAILCNDNVLALHTWGINGDSFFNAACDLEEPADQ